MNDIGHNNPPSMIEAAKETTGALSAFMSEHPVIDESSARDAKLQIDRGKLTIKDMEDERKKNVKPLNDQVDEINERYKKPREILKKITDELEARLKSYVREEERKRDEAAREAARIAEEAKQRALEAERLEREAHESASVGELGVDLAAHVAKADSAFDDFKRAERAAAIAEKDAKVKVGGGFSRALGLRTVETLIVEDAAKVLLAVGVSDGIRSELIKAARAYRSEYGELPPGMKSIEERK